MIVAIPQSEKNSPGLCIIYMYPFDIVHKTGGNFNEINGRVHFIRSEGGTNYTLYFTNIQKRADAESITVKQQINNYQQQEVLRTKRGAPGSDDFYLLSVLTCMRHNDVITIVVYFRRLL